MFVRTQVIQRLSLASAVDSVARHRPLAHVRAAGAVTALAALAAITIAVCIPVTYITAAYGQLVSLAAVRANIYAGEVTETALESPQLWNALLGDDGVDLTGLAIAAPEGAGGVGHPSEERRVLALNGRVILDISAPCPLPWPRFTVEQPLMQNGNRLGSIQIVRSFRSQLATALAVAACSIVLGALLLLALRIVPLRLLREALDRVTFLAGHDPLTGLPNRMLLADRLEQALAVSRLAGSGVAMLCLDLDHFKTANDTLGHPAGDTLLRVIAARLQNCLREGDTLARLGGDEFAVIQPGARQPQDAESVAIRLIEAARQPVAIDGQQVFIGVSIGIAISSPCDDGAELIKQADVALYQAKASRRGSYCFFEPEMNARLQHRRAMESDLRTALADGNLAVHYQPQIDLDSGTIIGAEALMRWTRPGEGPVSPAVFIPVAEETGLINPMGSWLLHEACREAVTWPPSMHIAVNVSPVQFRKSGLLDVVRSALAASGLDPHRLELEITEGTLLIDTAETLATLNELRYLGVRLAMDDFGTGYASLGYLQKFQFGKIKIDRSFVQNLGVDPNAVAIIRAVVGLTGTLGMSSNAEGVENAEQVQLLRALGCSEVQGYHYWAPMPADALRRLVVIQAGGRPTGGGPALTPEDAGDGGCGDPAPQRDGLPGLRSACPASPAP